MNCLEALKAATEALIELNNARHTDNASFRYIPDHTDSKFQIIEDKFGLSHFNSALLDEVIELTEKQEWKPIDNAPRDEIRFVCRFKNKPHVQFEAAILEDLEDNGLPAMSWVLYNMTTNKVIDDSWQALEWKPIV